MGYEGGHRGAQGQGLPAGRMPSDGGAVAAAYDVSVLGFLGRGGAQSWGQRIKIYQM